MQKHNLKILYVEDQKDISIEFYKIFTTLFKTICLAPNGETALKIFAENDDIDLIITDIEMPIMDGIKLISEIRQLNKTIPIYVTSAYDDKFEKHHAELNVKHYFSKPIRISDVIDKIKEDFNLN